MKKNSVLFPPIDKKALEQLITITNETVLVSYKTSDRKIFTSAELWNIQRQTKSRLKRRFFM